MEKATSEKASPFSTEPIGKLIAKFAIPCVISLLVNSLYNIVDQIFIGWGVGYIGNGATNVVFPITIIALALSLMIGDGGAAYLSLKLGEGDTEKARRGVGNAIVMVTGVSIVLAAVFLIFIDPILTLFGATDALRPYALEYGTVIGIGLPFMMIPAALNSMIRADGGPKYAMLSMVLGAVINTIFDPVFIFCVPHGRARCSHCNGNGAGRLFHFLGCVSAALQDGSLQCGGIPPERPHLRKYPEFWHQQFYHAVCNYNRHGADKQPSGILWRQFGVRV